jgi:hypothetical protein
VCCCKHSSCIRTGVLCSSCFVVPNQPSNAYTSPDIIVRAAFVLGSALELQEEGRIAAGEADGTDVLCRSVFLFLTLICFCLLNFSQCLIDLQCCCPLQQPLLWCGHIRRRICCGDAHFACRCFGQSHALPRKLGSDTEAAFTSRPPCRHQLHHRCAGWCV